jgi:hypothetical protein
MQVIARPLRSIARHRQAPLTWPASRCAVTNAPTPCVGCFGETPPSTLKEAAYPQVVYLDHRGNRRSTVSSATSSGPDQVRSPAVLQAGRRVAKRRLGATGVTTSGCRYLVQGAFRSPAAGLRAHSCCRARGDIGRGRKTAATRSLRRSCCVVLYNSSRGRGGSSSSSGGCAPDNVHHRVFGEAKVAADKAIVPRFMAPCTGSSKIRSPLAM